MNIGHFLLNDETYQIIELRDDKGTEYDQSDCLEPVADKCHVYGYGNPTNAVPAMGMILAKPVRKPENRILGASNIQ